MSLTTVELKSKLAVALDPIIITSEGVHVEGLNPRRQSEQAELFVRAFDEVCRDPTPTQSFPLSLSFALHLVRWAACSSQRRVESRLLKLMNQLSSGWVVVILDLDHIFAFNRDVSKRTRRNVIKVMTEVAMYFGREWS